MGIESAGLVVSGVLSGNRNFEGRISPHVRANYLASPPLVVAYALAGTTDINLAKEPLGTDSDGKPVMMSEIWPSAAEIGKLVDTIGSDMFQRSYGNVFDGNETWKRDQRSRRRALRVHGIIELHPGTAVLRRPDAGARAPGRHSRRPGARPAGAIPSPPITSHPPGTSRRTARPEPISRPSALEKKDFNSFGSRRGNDRVMTRGTFANIRIKNLMLPGTEGGYTVHVPSGDQSSIFEARRTLQDRGHASDRTGWERIRNRIVSRLGRQGDTAARRQSRDRSELRAHPPQQPRPAWVCCRCSSMRGSRRRASG